MNKYFLLPFLFVWKSKASINYTLNLAEYFQIKNRSVRLMPIVFIKEVN